MLKVLTLLKGLGIGGAEYMTYELVKNMNRRKFETPILCYGKELGTSLEEEMKAITNIEFGGVTGRISLFHLFKIIKIINTIKPDMIHAHMGGVAFAVPWSFLYQKPVVITVHTKPEKAFSKKNEMLVRLGLKVGFLKLVAVSESNSLRVQQYFGISNSKCTYVNNGIDLSRFYRTKHSVFTFINVARQDENKNQTMLLRVFKRIHEIDPNTKLFLIGEGPCHDELLRLRERFCLCDSVIIPGIVSTPENYYARSDVYVQTSHREALPLSILEALASGLPIISTDVGGIKDVICENGALIEDNDDKALFDAMYRFIKLSTDERKEMEEKSRKIAMKFSSKSMAENYTRIYYECVNNYDKML